MTGSRNTALFLRLMNDANVKIAAEEKAKPQPNSEAVGDPVRLQRQEERREKLGQLRARPRSKTKTGQIRNVFGHINVDP